MTDELNVLGTRIPIVRDALDGNEGEFTDAGIIRMSSTLSPHLEWEVLSHEAGHAVERVTDILRRLSDIGLREDQIEKVRELYMGTWLPVYLDTLERNGMLVRPEPEAKR